MNALDELRARRAQATYQVLTGFTPEQIADVLTAPAQGVCGWLSGDCHDDAEPGDWLCVKHRAGMPSMLSGSSPRMAKAAAR